LENGIPLAPHASMEDIKEGKPALFAHLRYKPASAEADDTYYNPRIRQDLVFFTPKNDNPKENTYTLIVPSTQADAYVLSTMGGTYGLNISNSYSKNLWTLAIILGIIAAWLIRKSIGTLSPLWYQIPLTLALGVAYYFITTVEVMKTQPCAPVGAYSVWDVFCVAPDSSSYYFGYEPGSTRGPGYPLFIRLVAGDWNKLQDFQEKNPHALGRWNEDVSDPLMKVSRAQIVLLLTAGLLLAFVIMRVLRTPLAVLFFLFFYDFHLFIFYELNAILTESLTQAWLLLTVACFLLFLWREWKWLLPVAALLVGASYVTRQASAYLAGVLGAMILWAFVRDFRKYWKVSVISVMLFAFVAATPSLYALWMTGKTGQEELTYQYRVVFALRLANENDIQNMPDEESRQWLTTALQRRNTKDKENDIMCKYEPYCTWVYRIQSPYAVLLDLELENHNNVPFYVQISNILLKRHWKDYIKLGLDGWSKTIFHPDMDRLQVFERYFTGYSINSLYVYLIGFVLMVLVRGKVWYASFVLILAHWAHILLTCLFSAPLARMVWASDGLVFIALFILALEAVRKFYPPMKMYVSVHL